MVSQAAESHATVVDDAGDFAPQIMSMHDSVDKAGTFEEFTRLESRLAVLR